MTRFTSFSIAALLMFAVALPASATDIYCTVVGARQGPFQGDPAARGSATQIAVYTLTQELKIPFDAATGQSTGKRQHSPLTIVKELDKSSPQFFEAAVTNEVLKSVTCTLNRNSANGQTRAYFKIVLTNALIVEIKDSGDGVNGAAHGDERERISFSFQKIELTDLDSNTTAVDDWTALQ
jgi:type VI secretion system secreted protein Hcp